MNPAELNAKSAVINFGSIGEGDEKSDIAIRIMQIMKVKPSGALRFTAKYIDEVTGTKYSAVVEMTEEEDENA